MKPKTFTAVTGIIPKQIVDAGVRKFYLYDTKDIQNFLEKKKEPPREELVKRELANEITLTVAALNAQATRLDKLNTGQGMLFEKMQSITDNQDLLIKKLDHLLKSLGETASG